MKTLTYLIEKAYDTLEEVEEYTIQAMNLKATHKELADVYFKIAEEHVGIFKMLHDEMGSLIEEEKRNGKHPTPEMEAIFNYEHERIIKGFNENRLRMEEYKKMY
jgi:hypothetical protein